MTITYRVAYGTSDGNKAVRAYDEGRFATLEGASKRMRTYKRTGFWAWVEDDQGIFIPVPGAMRSSLQKHYPAR